MVKKYWHVINIGIQNTLVYRVNFLFRCLFSFIPLLATLSLWRTIYDGRTTGVGAYTLAQMISYYLVVTIVDALTAVAEDDWQIAADIKDGNISQFLLKPIDYLTYRLCLFGTGRLMYVAVAFVPTVVFILCQRNFFVLPPDVGALGWFLVSVLLAGLLQFLISYTMALLAFWLTEVSTFIFILFAFEYVASGHLFPLDLLPPALARAALHAVSVSGVLPGEHLHGPDDRRDAGAGIGGAGGLGDRRVSAGPLRLEPGHQKVFGGGRMTA